MVDRKGREELNRLATQMRRFLDAAEESGRKEFTSAEREKWNKFVAAYDAQEDLVCRNEGIASLDQTRLGPQIIAGDPMETRNGDFRRGGPRARSAHAQCFTKYIRSGLAALNPDEMELLQSRYAGNGNGGLEIRNAQGTTGGAQGGYVVPEGFSYQLEEAMKWFGGVDGVVGEFRTDDGRPFPWPTVNDTTNMGRLIGENVQNTETDVVFGQVTFNAFIASSDIVLVPLSLLQDSAFDIDGLLAKLLGIRLGRLRNYYATIGTGTNQPTGILVAAAAAGLTLQLGSGSTSTIAYADLVDLEHEVDPAYRYNSSTRWMFNDTTLKVLKKLVDGNNRPLWSPGLTASFQDGPAVQLLDARPTILGHAYVVNQNMPSPAANAYSVLFGDMSCFKLRRVKEGITVMRLVERYADYLQQGFIAWERFDSNLIDAGTHPIAVLQQSAS
jgi:HK97 family phage major capsid protein